ncbi:class I SAM-dependent RNA methyltransferase [Candidatus Saccharibacteria bacterium]|nr:class I SAM-dependent RNA methyltransferase [Candidatus Saccharibacteria bacterium]
MIRVEKIIPGGQGLGTSNDGKKAFFWNALPGESVEEYTVTKNKSHYMEAIATKIVNPSEHRVTPQDECYLSTSPWQIINYNYELQLKQELITEIFREHHINIDTPKIFTDGKDYHYRNKMEYALYWDHDTNRIHLAFHQRGSHRKIPITNSSIERPEIFAKAQQIIDGLNHNHDEARRYQSLLLRCNQQGEVSGGLYENKKPHPIFPTISDTILGHTYNYSPNGFFQINLPVYEMALKEITQHIVTDEVLDLYSGVGTIGLSVARDKSLTLVESDKYAYSELVENCERCNTITFEEHVRRRGERGATEPRDDRREGVFREGDSIAPNPVLAKSEEVLNYINHNQTVILDPPRAGCDKKLIEKLLDVRPPKIIYLSCNPATQARDVKLLLEKYQIDEIKTFNFFPHTPHIENLVVLSSI